MNIFDSVERLASIDRSQVTLDPQRCLNPRDPHRSCTVCSDLCPEGAISAGEPPVVDADACRSCYACLPACPMGAFSADDAVPSLLNCAARLETPQVELLCSLHPAGDRGLAEEQVGVQVHGCLAGLGAGAYLSLAALGLQHIAVRLDGCTGCRWGSLLAQVRAQISLAQQILAGQGSPVTLQVVEAPFAGVSRPLWNAANPPLSRRDLFRMAKKQGQIALARTMSKDETHAGPRPTRDRQRMLAALEHLPTAEEVIESDLPLPGFYRLRVSESCTACGACVRACVLDALGLVQEEQAFQLTLEAWKCSGCGLCLHVCYPQAIELVEGVTARQVFESPMAVLRSGPLAECMRCKTRFAPAADEKYCPICEYRRTHPFGAVLPPGLAGAQNRAVQPSKEKGV